MKPSPAVLVILLVMVPFIPYLVNAFTYIVNTISSFLPPPPQGSQGPYKVGEMLYVLAKFVTAPFADPKAAAFLIAMSGILLVIGERR